MPSSSPFLRPSIIISTCPTLARLFTSLIPSYTPLSPYDSRQPCSDSRHSSELTALPFVEDPVSALPPSCLFAHHSSLRSSRLRPIRAQESKHRYIVRSYLRSIATGFCVLHFPSLVSRLSFPCLISAPNAPLDAAGSDDGCFSSLTAGRSATRGSGEGGAVSGW